MSNRFWVTTGNATWDNSTTTNWSASSGGASGASVPAGGDTAIFDANSGVGTITTNYAVSITALSLAAGYGGTVTFGATNTFTTSGAVTLTAGTLNTNGQTCNWGSFSSNNANTRALTLGATTLTLTGNWAAQNTTNLTLSAASSTINQTGASIIFTHAGSAGSAGSFGTVSMTGGGDVTLAGSSSNTFVNFTCTGTAVKTSEIDFVSNITVSGTLTLTGNSAVNRLFVTSGTVGTVTTLTAAAVSITNADFQDITGAGAGSPFTGTSVGNAQGNSGITFTNAATQTWNANTTGNWSASANWTSRVPLPQDNVAINGLTSGTVTADMPRLGNNIDLTTSSGGTVSFTTANAIFGNVVLNSTVAISGTSTTTLSGRGAQTLTSNTKQFTQAITMNGPSGTYTLQDNFSTALGLTVSGGTFAASTFNVTCQVFTMSSANATISMGTGTWFITQTTAITVWTVTAGTVTASTSTITINQASSSTRTFAGGGKTYGTLTYTVAGSTGTLIITGANTFATINFSDVTNARTITFTASTTTTITNTFNVNGTSGKLMTINSSSSGTQATLNKSGGGAISLDYLNIQDSKVTNGSWYAGANSNSVSNNTGWLFRASPGASVIDMTLLGVG